MLVGASVAVVPLSFPLVAVDAGFELPHAASRDNINARIHIVEANLRVFFILTPPSVE
ncbi:hypothetical protein D3C76_1878190 [compost metagenome]